MDLNLAPDPVASFRIFQSRILEEYGRIAREYNLTEIDATHSIGEQQAIVRQLVDETLGDYNPPDHEFEREEEAAA